MTLNHLSLFSGIGGFELGLQLAGLDFQTIGYVEKDTYCQAVLQERMNDGYLNPAPIIRDITECDFRPMAGLVDCITGGFPCQPHSTAGKQQGAADTRNLWPETLGCIRDVGPRWVMLENVPGILANGYGGTVVGQLSEIGYDCIWHCVPAAAVGAPHLRWRWWCLAYAKSAGRPPRASTGESGGCSPLAYRHWEPSPFGGDDKTNEKTSGVGRNRNRRSGDDDRGKLDAQTNGSMVPDSEHVRSPGEQGERRGEYEAVGRGEQLRGDGQDGDVANAECTGSTLRANLEPSGTHGHCREQWWATEPDVGRVANGIPKRVDRLKSLGNGVVPAVVARVCKELLPLINTTEENNLGTH